jgi:small subunit ribosomal protein S17
MANTATKPAPKADKKLVTLRGVVESDKRNQTRTVVVRFQARHAKYGKILHERTVLQAHDEKNESKQGDVVEVQPCRRMSKTKTWRIQRVVERRSNA